MLHYRKVKSPAGIFADLQEHLGHLICGWFGDPSTHISPRNSDFHPRYSKDHSGGSWHGAACTTGQVDSRGDSSFSCWEALTESHGALWHKPLCWGLNIWFQREYESALYFFFFWIHKGQTLLGEQGKMGWETKLRKQKKWVFCFVVLLFCFNIYFPPTNWVFTAHSVILTILKAELGEQGQCRKAAITQKDLFYQWELSGCQLGAAWALMRTQRHKVVSVPSANAH